MVVTVRRLVVVHHLMRQMVRAMVLVVAVLGAIQAVGEVLVTVVLVLLVLLLFIGWSRK
jgi:hypothetical protein